MTTQVMLIIMIILILFSGIFSATETAFSSLSKVKLKIMAEDKKRGATLAYKLSEKYDELITTVLISNNIVNIILTTISTLFFIKILKGDSIAPTISTIVVTIVVLIFGEITPKILARVIPEKIAIFTSVLIYLMLIITKPIALLFTLWKKLIIKIFKIREDKAVTDEELITIVDEAEQEGGLNKYESELIKNAIEFDDLTVENILVPRVSVIYVYDNESKDSIEEKFIRNGYSRFPVIHENIDNILGVISQKQFYSMEKDEEITKILTPPLLTHKTMRISKLLRIMQKEKKHMAIVVDEFGGTLGIVTLEDILEELVGDILDETDDDNILEIQEEEKDTYKIIGSTNIEKVFKLLEFEEEDTDAMTFGGWIIDYLDRIPKPDEVFNYQNWKFTILKSTEKQILEVKVVKNSEQEEV